MLKELVLHDNQIVQVILTASVPLRMHLTTLVSIKRLIEVSLHVFSECSIMSICMICTLIQGN